MPRRERRPVHVRRRRSTQFVASRNGAEGMLWAATRNNQSTSQKSDSKSREAARNRLALTGGVARPGQLAANDRSRRPTSRLGSATTTSDGSIEERVVVRLRA